VINLFKIKGRSRIKDNNSTMNVSSANMSVSEMSSILDVTTD